MRDGRLPYRDFYMEYPPGAIPTFLAPLLLEARLRTTTSRSSSRSQLRESGSSSRVRRRSWLLRAEPPRDAATFVLMVDRTRAALGAVVLNRYDLWPALICRWPWLRCSPTGDRLGFGLLALGCVVKLYPLVVLPMILIHVLRKSGHRALAGAATSFVVVFAVRSSRSQLSHREGSATACTRSRSGTSSSRASRPRCCSPRTTSALYSGMDHRRQARIARSLRHAPECPRRVDGARVPGRARRGRRGVLPRGREQRDCSCSASRRR